MAIGTATANATKKDAKIAAGIIFKLFNVHRIAPHIKPKNKIKKNAIKNIGKKFFIYMTPCNQPIAVITTANVVIAITIVLS